MPTLIQAAREEDYHGRTVRIYRGWLDTQTMALVTTPELRRIGIMDTMPVTLGPNSGTIVVNCESELARWQRVRGRMYTHESQALIYSGDRLFDMVPTIQSRVLDWTKKTLFGAVAGMAAARANAAR